MMKFMNYVIYEYDLRRRENGLLARSRTAEICDTIVLYITFCTSFIFKLSAKLVHFKEKC